MSIAVRTTRMLAVTLLLTGGVAAATPAVAAEEGPAAAVQGATLPAPEMTGATVVGTNIHLSWSFPAITGVAFHVYADGEFVGTSGYRSMDIFGYRYVDLTGDETFTVVATDNVRNDRTDWENSPPSNGLVPTSR